MQMGDQLLWDKWPHDAIRPVHGLLPLLVFSLRSAYQHALAWTVLRAAEGREGICSAIELSTENPGRTTGLGIGYRIHLDFPHPLPEAAREGPTWLLPCGDFERDVQRYRDKTGLWAVVTPIVTINDRGATIRLTIRAYA